MLREQSEIVAELQNLCAQYKAEVPGRSQAWPKSIKERVAELSARGLGDSEVARLVPIPMQTIYSWRHSKKTKSLEPAFLPVKINKVSTVTVKKKPKAQKMKIPTVTVTTPGGFKVEGLEASEVLDFFEKLERVY